jgi:hypothetical protein
MAAIPDQRIGLLLSWHKHQKAEDLSLFMLKEEQDLFKAHFSYINVEETRTVKIMPLGAIPI